MEILPPKYVRIEHPYSSGMEVMLKQKQVHNERLKFFHKISKIHADLIRLNNEADLMEITGVGEINKVTFNVQA